MADYMDNIDAESIAERLIPEFHPHLQGLKISHLFKLASAKKKKPKQPREGKKVVMAKASKVPDKMRAIGAVSYFVIEYDELIWQDLTEEKRVALVDHELAHCGNDADGVYMKAHGLEEFGDIVLRHGLWKSDVKQFADAVEEVVHNSEAVSG